MTDRVGEVNDVVEISYYFTERDGRIWKVQSINGGDWEWIETPYNKIPYIITKRYTESELRQQTKETK